MKNSAFYAVISVASYLMLFIFGSRLGLVYMDIILVPQQYIAPLIIISVTVLSVLLTRYTEVEIYLIGILVTVYGFFFIATIPYSSLLPFSALALISTFALFYKTAGFNRRSVYKLSSFIFIVVGMFALGGALRFDSGPPGYALAFGSIYDDVLPGGVPLMFTDGVVLYARYFVLSVSVPIVILFTLLSVVLTENYYLIFNMLRAGGSGNVKKTLSNAVTVLSCQCEGITASFPSVIATILFTAIIPLISESILFLLLTDILIVAFYMKGKRVKLLDLIWRMTASGTFFLVMLSSMIAVPIFLTFAVYLSLQSNLLVFSAINVMMFVYGIFIVYIIHRAFPVRVISRTTTYFLAAMSSVGMFIWYVPAVTLPAVTNPAVFSIMGGVSVASGIASGLIFKGREESVRMLYFEYITMMFSMLAIVVFYISAIGLHVLWPEFGIGEQLKFSLLLWGLTLPVMWLSTNISLNADSTRRDHRLLRTFTFSKGPDSGEVVPHYQSSHRD